MQPSVSLLRPRKLPDEPHRRLSPAAVGAIVGVTPDTVRRWVALGLIPAERLGPGRRIQIDPADLEKLFSSDPRGTAYAREPVDVNDEDGDQHGANDDLVEAV